MVITEMKRTREGHGRDSIGVGLNEGKDLQSPRAESPRQVQKEDGQVKRLMSGEQKRALPVPGGDSQGMRGGQRKKPDWTVWGQVRPPAGLEFIPHTIASHRRAWRGTVPGSGRTFAAVWAAWEAWRTGLASSPSGWGPGPSGRGGQPQREWRVLRAKLLKTFLFLPHFILGGCKNIEHFVSSLKVNSDWWSGLAKTEGVQWHLTIFPGRSGHLYLSVEGVINKHNRDYSFHQDGFQQKSSVHTGNRQTSPVPSHYVLWLASSVTYLLYCSVVMKCSVGIRMISKLGCLHVWWPRLCPSNEGGGGEALCMTTGQTIHTF